MLTISVPENYDVPVQTVEEVCYTELQPLNYFITSSDDPCLPDVSEEVTCVEYVIHTEEVHTESEPKEYLLYSYPESPESLADEYVTEDDLLCTQLYGHDNVYEEDDDDASVMLDFMDLSFLDDPSTFPEKEVDAATARCVVEYLDLCPAQYITVSCDGTSSYRQQTPSPFPHPSLPTPSHTPPPSSPHSPTTNTNTTITTLDNTPFPISSSSSSSSSTATYLTVHYDNSSESTTTTTTDATIPITTTDTTNSNAGIIIADFENNGSFPPSPPDSTASVSTETVIDESDDTMESDDGEREATATTTTTTTAKMDFDRFDDSEDDDDEEAGYKPYCDSRRGAKKNLLWKFLLWSLDHHTDVVQWTDIEQGVFKFMDTTRVSDLWGQRKKKRHMTFEKLSRGIRHYYKRGLMERLRNTRLVYKFNWAKVPKRYRKA